MVRRSLIMAVALTLLMAVSATAQTGAGSLRGYVTDEQGGALPGVAVSARSDALIQPASSVTDAEGYYRLINLPPGTYEVSADLSGFAAFKRQGVILRAGANFQVDITMKLASISETVTVSGDSPMLEVSNPSNVLNISGEFQRDMPIQARRNWSDFLEITPGVHSRPFDDGSGRMVYFGHSTEHFAHVVQLEGAIASNYQDAQITYVAMGADMISDTQVKTGGVDASAPMGVGLNINVITKSGGNTFKGSGAFAYQPADWNGNNVNNCSSSASCKPTAASTVGTPTTAIIRQLDAGIGGPIKRDRIWFFGSIRRADLESGISRTAVEVQRLNDLAPTAELFNNTTESWQPYGKITMQARKHQIAAFVQQDRLKATGDREYHYSRTNVYSTGGGLYGGKVTSLWGDKMTTTLLASYNNKGGADASTFEGWAGSGPTITIHRDASLTGGRLVGSGRLVSGGNFDDGTAGAGQASYSYLPSSQITLRGDLTYFKDGMAGSHEFMTGFFGAPRSTYDTTTFYLNNGFILEEQRQVDPNDPSKGTIPFHRRYASPLELTTRMARDRNWALYVQDNWKPTPRLTANIGLRADWVRRYDKIFDVIREDAHILQPRLGFSYLVTKDAKNVLRGSYVRLGEQMMGRDAVTLFGATGAVGIVDTYDNNLDGTFETSITTAARTGALAPSEFDPDLHQPYVDEGIVGYRMQLPYSIGIDVAGIHRVYKDTYARVDINGFYPSGPNQPFGGFGKVDPNRGIVYQQTNNSWSRLNYTALEITATKNLTHGFQFMAGINRQWQHISGDWNPTDPARFIQPSAFPNNKLLYMPRGNNEDNSLPIQSGGTTHTYGPTWQKYRLNFGGTWYAPYGLVMAASYTVEAGPWSGAVVTQLPVGDPALAVFGPALVVSSTGVSQSNPLSTRMRFAFPTRGDGQVMAPAQKTLGLKIGKKLNLTRTQNVELAANIFNLLNAGDYTQYNYNGANEQFNPNYLGMRNQQPARALQVTMVYRF
jgi:Carboxypeptidase regulatory-like domain/TonB dependent receptor-like, beta-barrel